MADFGDPSERDARAGLAATATPARTRGRRDTVLSRSMWTLLDQGLSSLFSLAAGFAAARALTLAQFGLFAALFTSFLVARGVVKAVALDPITIRHAGPGALALAGHAHWITAATAALGALAALGAAVVSPLVTVPLALAAGAALATLLTVDTSRLLDIASGAPGRAARTSTALLAAGVAILAFTWRRPLDLWVLLALLAVAGLAALVVGPPTRGRWRHWRETRTWTGEQRQLAGPLLLEFLSNTGVLFLSVYLLAMIDLAEAGAVRAAQMVAGPLFMLFTGITQVVMTEGSRASSGSDPDHGGRDMGVVVAQRSLLVSALAAVGYLAVVYTFRADLASALKLTDPGHVAALSNIVIMAGLTAPSFVASGLLRALAQPRLLLRARLVSLVSVTTATVFGAFNGGAAAVIQLGIIAQIANLPLWAGCVWIGIRARRR